jgi:hypothetical protein
VLAPAGTTPCLAELEVAHGEPPTARTERFAPLVVDNPQIGLAWLVDASLRREAGVLPLDAGSGRGYSAVLTVPPA